MAGFKFAKVFLANLTYLAICQNFLSPKFSLYIKLLYNGLNITEYEAFGLWAFHELIVECTLIMKQHALINQS